VPVYRCTVSDKRKKGGLHSAHRVGRPLGSHFLNFKDFLTQPIVCAISHNFYHASALSTLTRDIDIANLSVRPSVRPSVHPVLGGVSPQLGTYSE